MRPWRSFRLRLALLSAVLAGGTLVGFGAIAWKLIYEAKISRLDASLEIQLLRAGRFLGSQEWSRYATQLPRELQTTTRVAVRILGREGQVIYQSEPGFPALQPLPPVPRPPRPFPPSGDLPRLPPPPLPQRYLTVGHWRVGMIGFPEGQVAIAVDLRGLGQEMDLIRNSFLVVLPLALLLIALAAWWMAGSALAPLRQLTATIQTVSIQGLDQRVAHAGADQEFAELIQVFNQMLERLERSFKQASRFSGDAAHELKTPLTILQGELEQALQQAELGSPLQQRLSHLLDEVRRLSGIVRKLLLLSLADAGQMRLTKARIDLSQLVLELLEDLELLAPELTAYPEIRPNLQVLGDRDLLLQVLQNLLSNAIKYNLPEGWIKIQAEQRGAMVCVTFSNASLEIPPGDRPHLFDRFHRVDPARTRQVEGTGLGLSLAREIARAHGGDLVLEAATAERTAFRLSLPTARR